MPGPVPLSRFPLVHHTDIDAVLAAMNGSVGGERRCRAASRTHGSSFSFNFLRLGRSGVISQRTTATSIRHLEDSAGAFCLCLEDKVDMQQGRRTFSARAGQLLCMLPGAARTFHYGEGFRSFGVRVSASELDNAMRLLGHEDPLAWSTITTVLDQDSPQARGFCRYVRDVVSIYDDAADIPDRRVDLIMGRNLAHHAASMLSALIPGLPRVDGPSFGVAEAAEQVIAERFASQLSASDIAEAVGQTLPCVRASLLLYTGLLPNELLTLVRLVAADEYVRTFCDADPERIAMACGFVTPGRYLAARGQRDRLVSQLRRRTAARGFAL